MRLACNITRRKPEAHDTLFGLPLTPNRWPGRRTVKLAVRIIKVLAPPRQYAQCRERFQIQPPSHRQPRLRLIGAQGQFHRGSVDSVNLFTIQSISGEDDLRGDNHIALHARRSGLKWCAGKNCPG